MVWDCMGWNGAEFLTEIEGKIDAKQYVILFEGKSMKSVEELELDLEDFFFQQDNGPKYTSQRAANWFVEQD